MSHLHTIAVDEKLEDNKVSVDNRYRDGGPEGEEKVTKGEASTTDRPGVLNVKFDGIPKEFSCK